MSRRVGIFIFENVEVLDFAGPFEVFSRTRLEGGPESRRSDEGAPFEVLTIGKQAGLIRATGGLGIYAEVGFENAGSIDVLVVPGGFGTRPLLEDGETLAWIRQTAEQAELVTSVCTGALLLAKAGLLAGRRATTHWCALDALAEVDSSIHVCREERVVHDGVITSAGVAAGIDMAFEVVELLHGKEVADETARYIEYPR